MKTDLMTGNEAAALGVKLCKPNVIAAFPITPASETVEKLSEYVNDGELNARIFRVEGEHSAMSMLEGASEAGGRTFTATSSVGLGFMHNVIWTTARKRLPIVMSISNRTMVGLVACGLEDTMADRDTMWLQFYCETVQEVLDTIIQAYKIAEDKRVRLPIMVCQDGFYLSHLSEKVEIPTQEDVDEFLPPYKPENTVDQIIGSRYDPFLGIQPYDACYERYLAMERAKKIIKEVGEDYGRLFGRKYSLIDQYRSNDAQVTIVTMTSIAGTAKSAIDNAREKNQCVGLVRLRVFRPFPKEDFIEAVRNAEILIVIDKTERAILLHEVKAALYHLEKRPIVIGAIVGIAGLDTTVDDFMELIEKGWNVYETKRPIEEPIWLQVTEEE